MHHDEAMSEKELAAIREHHDKLIQMGMLELRAEEIRATSPTELQPQMLRPIQTQMHELDEVISHLRA